MRVLGLLLVAVATFLPAALPVLAASLPTEDATSVCAAPLGNGAESLRLAPVAWSPPCPAPTLAGWVPAGAPSEPTSRATATPAPSAVESSRLL